MAVRPIDGNELYRIEKLLDTDIVRQDKVALNLLEQVLYDIQHVPTLTPPNEWVSVEERLPKYNIREDGELISSKILCYCETDKTVHLVVSQKFYTGRKGEIVHPVFRYYDEWGDEIENVSHWMPLPAPPDKDNHVPAKAPNEPLTIEQLREMKDEPAYLKVFDPLLKSGWHIIKAVTKDKIIFRGWQTVYVPIDSMGVNYNLYRCPPEGEEGNI